MKHFYRFFWFIVPTVWGLFWPMVGHAALQTAMGLSADNQPVTIATTFDGFIKDAAGQDKGNRAQVSTSEAISVGTTIVPDNEHLEQNADILIAVMYKNPQQNNLMFTRQGAMGWQIWDGNPAHLAVAEQRLLEASFAVEVVSNFPFTGLPGDFTIFLAYRLENGTLIYNGKEPIQFSVTEANPTTPGTPGMVAALKFTPEQDGFNFENYGNDPQSMQDLTADDLILLFGRDKICRSADGECVLDGPARNWLEKQIKGMDGGHCEGMAVTSLRFNRGLPFKGKTMPTDFQPGASKVFELTKDSVRNSIAYYFVTQSLDPTASQTSEIGRNNTPASILDLLVNAMQSGNSENLYTLGIYEYKNGQTTGGHAITPFAVEDKGNGEFWVHVYDNNYPKETRYVKINRNDNTWVYEGAATKPGEEASAYRGDANTHSLDLTAMKGRDIKFTCPFCNLSAAERRANTPRYIEFSLTGEGRVLIRDNQGKAVGYDFDAGKFVNDIANSEQIAIRGGLGKNIPPIYRLPADNAPFQIEIGGVSEQEVDLDLVATSAGYVVGFEGILLDAEERLLMTMDSNGSVLSFTASQDAETPDVFLSYDPVQSGDPSYLFEVDGFELEAGKTITVTLNTADNTLDFKDDDGNEDQYELQVTRIDDQGAKQRDFKNLNAKSGASSRLQFTDWDHPTYQKDDEGDGYADDEASPL